MTERKPRSRKVKVAALSFGQALAGITTLIVFAVLSREFADNKSDYAAFRQTLLAYMMVAPFLSLGVNKGIFFFLPNEKSRIRGRVIDSLLIVLITATLFSLFIVLGGNQLLAQRFSNPLVASLLLLFIPFFFANQIFRLFDPILTCQDRVIELAFFNIAARIVIGGLTILPVFIWMNPSAPIIGRMIGAVISCIAGLFLVFRYLPKDGWRPSLDASIELVKFSFPLGLATMIGYLNIQLDKFIVSAMVTPDESAIFFNGAIELPLIGIVTGSIATVLMVDMRKAVTENRNDEAVKLFRMTAVKTSFVLFPIAIYLMIFADSFICTLFSTEYRESAAPFRIYLLLIPIRTVVFGALMLALGMNMHVLVRAVIGLLLNLGLSIMFVQWLGPIGAAISTVLIVLFWSVPFCMVTLGWKLNIKWYTLLPFKHFGMVLIQLSLFTIGMLGLYFAMWNSGHFLKLAVSGCVALVWMSYWWKGRIYKTGRNSPDFNNT